MTTLFLDRECTITLTQREGKGGDKNENLLQTILTEQRHGLSLGSSASLPFLFVPSRQRPEQQNTNEEVVPHVESGEAIIVTSIGCFRFAQQVARSSNNSNSKEEGNGDYYSDPNFGKSSRSSGSDCGLCLRGKFFSLASSLFVDKSSLILGNSNNILLPPLPSAITTVGLDSLRRAKTSASVSFAACGAEDDNNVMPWGKALIYRTMSIPRGEDNSDENGDCDDKKRKEKRKGSKHATVLVGELYIPSTLLLLLDGSQKAGDTRDGAVGALDMSRGAGRTASSSFSLLPTSLPSSSAVAINSLIIEGSEGGGGIAETPHQASSSSMSNAEALVCSISALASNNLQQHDDTRHTSKFAAASSKVAHAALIPDLIGLPLLVDLSASAAGTDATEASSSQPTTHRTNEIVQFVYCYYYGKNNNNNNLLEKMKNVYFGHLMSSAVSSGELDRVYTSTCTRILHVSQHGPSKGGNGNGSSAKSYKGSSNNAQNKGKTTPSDNTGDGHPQQPLCVGYVSSKVRLSFSASSSPSKFTHRSSSLSPPSPPVTSTNTPLVRISGDIARRLRKREIGAVKALIRYAFVLESVLAATVESSYNPSSSPKASAAHTIGSAKFKGGSSLVGLLVYGPAGCGQQEIVATALEELCAKRKPVANTPSANEESTTNELKATTAFSLCPFPLSFRGVEVSSSVDDEEESNGGQYDSPQNPLFSSSRLISPMLASVVDDPAAAWEFFTRFPLAVSKNTASTCMTQSPPPRGSHAMLVPIVIDNAEEVFPHDDDLITQVNLQRLKRLHGFLSSLNTPNNAYDNKNHNKKNSINMNNVDDARGGCGDTRGSSSMGSDLLATCVVPFVVSFTGKSGSGSKSRINRIALATLYSDGIISLDCSSSSSSAGREDAEKEGEKDLEGMSTSPVGLIEIALPSVSERGEMLKMVIEQRLFSLFNNTIAACKKEIARFSFEQSSSSSLGVDGGSLLSRTLASALCRTAPLTLTRDNNSSKKSRIGEDKDLFTFFSVIVKLIDRILEGIAISRARYAVGTTNTNVIRIGMDEAERLWNSAKLGNAGVETETERAVGGDCDNEDFVATAKSLFISLTRAYEHSTGTSVASHEYLKEASDSEHEEPSSSSTRAKLLSFLQTILVTRGANGSSSYADHEDTVEETTVVALPMSSPAGPRLTTWDDIGGLEDVKKRMRDALIRPRLVPESYTRLGVTPPKGILLYGPPGCAKTTLVKALCSEGLYSFIYVDCASVLSSYVGESEQYLRDVFARARSQSPCIVFFDEVDAVSGKRDGGAKGGGGESDTAKLLSTLLIEMDGFSSGGGGGGLSEVCFVGATNLPHRVDSALLRPGRFDLLVHVPLPDASERYGILRALLLKNYHHQFTANSGTSTSSGCGDGHRAAYAYRCAIAFASLKSFLTSTTTVACSDADESSSNNEVQVTPSTNKTMMPTKRGPSEALKSLFFPRERDASLDAVQPKTKTTDEAQPSTTQKFSKSSLLNQYTLNNVIDIRFILGEIMPESYAELCALAATSHAAGRRRGEGNEEGLDDKSNGSFSEKSSFVSEEEKEIHVDTVEDAAAQSEEHEKPDECCAAGRHLLRPLRYPAQTAAKSILTIAQTLLESHSGADITAIIKEACTAAQRRFVESEKAKKVMMALPQEGSNGNDTRSPTVTESAPATTLLVLTLADLQDAVLRSNPTVYDAAAIDSFAASH